jgi:hypothetical protein
MIAAKRMAAVQIQLLHHQLGAPTQTARHAWAKSDVLTSQSPVVAPGRTEMYDVYDHCG